MRIRLAQPNDLGALMHLCAEHAIYERAVPPGPEAASALASALWGSRPRAWVLVVEEHGQLCGYAAFALEFAAWTGRDYLHLDCLYLCQPFRGRGWGHALMNKVIQMAAEFDVSEMQWQTPNWNTHAIRFYQRLGAHSNPKLRFTLPIPGPFSGKLK